jgi:heparanase
VIDEKTFQPNASYWGAVLWRRLMGNKILDAGPLQPGMHLYAHCQRGTPGGVTLLAINMRRSSASVAVTGPADIYALTSPDLQSTTVLLNGRRLAVKADDTLPVMNPARAKKSIITLAPTSIAFITLPRARNPGCAA